MVLLLDQGAAINAPSIVTRAPLMEAIEGGNKEIIQLLVKMGADIYFRDRMGWGVLHEAIQHGNPEIVNLLLDIGADIDSMNNNGHTPLAFAILRGRSGITQVLLDSGADPCGVSISSIRNNITARSNRKVVRELGLVREAQEKLNRQFLDEMVQI